MNPALKAYLDKLHAETRAQYAEIHKKLQLQEALLTQSSTGARPLPLTRSAVAAFDGSLSIDTTVPVVVSDAFSATTQAREVPAVAYDAPVICTEMAPVTCSTECSSQVNVVTSVDEVHDTATTVHSEPAVDLNDKEVEQLIPARALPASTITEEVVPPVVTTDAFSRLVSSMTSQTYHLVDPSGLAVLALRPTPWPSLLKDPTKGNKVRPIPWPSFACLISMVPRDTPVLSQPMMQVMGDLNLGLVQWRLAICSMAAHLFQSMQQMGALSTGCSNNIFLQFMQIGPYELGYAAVVYLLEDYLRPVNLEPRREWPPLVKANFSELCSFRQFDSDSTLCLFPWNPGDYLLRITTGFLTASSGSQWHIMCNIAESGQCFSQIAKIEWLFPICLKMMTRCLVLLSSADIDYELWRRPDQTKNCDVLVKFRILHIFLVPSIKLQSWPSCRYTFTHFEQQFFSQLPFSRTDKMPETRRLTNISVQWQFLHQEEFSGSGHCDTEGNYEPDGLYMVAGCYDAVHLVLYPCQPSHTEILVYVVMTMVPRRIKIFYGLYSFSDSLARELPEFDVYRAILCELMLVLDQHLDISNSQLDDSNTCCSLLWLSSDYLPNCVIDVIGSNRGIYLLDISWDPGGLAWPLLLELARRVVFEGGKCVIILTAAYLVHASYISLRRFTPSSIVVQRQWDTHPSQEKNSQHISMLPCFISKPISCEGNHGWYLGILSLFMIQPVQFAAELHYPDSSLFASVALLFGHKQKWTPTTAKFSVFHQQLLEVFQKTYSTPDRFSVCPIRRSCCLVLLPMLDVYNVVCYELRLAVGIQLGINELQQERISENSGSFARCPPDRVTNIAEHAKRGSELIHAVQINYKGVQSYSCYMVQQREGIGLAPNFRTMKQQIPSTEVSETGECQHFISTTAYHQMWDYFEVGSSPTYPKSNEDGSVQHRVVPTYTCWWRLVQVCAQCPMLIGQMVNGVWEQANNKVYLLLHWKLKDASWHRGTNIQPGTLVVCGAMPCEYTPFLNRQLNISKSRPDNYNSRLPALQWTQGHFQGGRSVLPVTAVFAQGFVDHEYYLSFDCDYDDNGYILDWISIDHNFYLCHCLVEVYSNFDYHHDSDHIHEHRMHWNPGGCQWCRLRVKPNFKEGGMLGALLTGAHTWAGPRTAHGLGWAVHILKHCWLQVSGEEAMNRAIQWIRQGMAPAALLPFPFLLPPDLHI